MITLCPVLVDSWCCFLHMWQVSERTWPPYRLSLSRSAPFVPPPGRSSCSSPGLWSWPADRPELLQAVRSTEREQMNKHFHERPLLSFSAEYLLTHLPSSVAGLSALGTSSQDLRSGSCSSHIRWYETGSLSSHPPSRISIRPIHFCLMMNTIDNVTENQSYMLFICSSHLSCYLVSLWSSDGAPDHSRFKYCDASLCRAYKVKPHLLI